MPWPDFHISKKRYQVTCPYCGKILCYTHPSAGKGRYPGSFMHHLMMCNPGSTCRERSYMAVKAWAKRSEVVS